MNENIKRFRNLIAHFENPYKDKELDWSALKFDDPFDRLEITDEMRKFYQDMHNRTFY